MKFQNSIVIEASPKALFDLTQDYGRRLEWDPFLKLAMLLDGAREAAVGVRTLCVARNGLEMETAYVSFNPPRICAVKMTRGPWLIGSFAGSWHFDELTPGRTQVSFRYHLQGKPRWLSWIISPVMRWIFGWDTRRRLVALKAAVEEKSILANRTKLTGTFSP